MDADFSAGLWMREYARPLSGGEQGPGGPCSPPDIRAINTPGGPGGPGESAVHAGGKGGGRTKNPSEFWFFGGGCGGRPVWAGRLADLAGPVRRPLL
jgi:hypothetical protein